MTRHDGRGANVADAEAGKRRLSVLGLVVEAPRHFGPGASLRARKKLAGTKAALGIRPFALSPVFLIALISTISAPLAAQAFRLDGEREFFVEATSTISPYAGSVEWTRAAEHPGDLSSIPSAQTDAVEFVGGLDCSANQVSSGQYRVSVGGILRANRSVSDAHLTAYVEPGSRRVNERFLGNIDAGQTRNFTIAGTVTGAAPTRCRVEFRGTTRPTDPEPPPDPDPPPPPPTSGCTPTTTALQFDGGYKVSMCYRTPEGKVGQARSGIWASGQAGLLWFFDRGNAEVLVKVLDGCSHNGHRWAFVAPVTTLEFNLRIAGPDGKTWTHGNRQGATASSKSDLQAFACDEENDGGGDGDGNGGGDGDGNGGGDGDGNGGGASGTRYNVGDTIATLPAGSWFLSGSTRGCNLGSRGGQTSVECSRNGFFEYRPYRYTCEASTCGIEGRTVTAGAWLETRP